ncbi:winged helix-turn-helix transcriptional regulator [Streptacidiphilus sp. N1-12]|uniref:Winged helix-turn-helix transcriptional regulator n=2 Tax=Streptacidiphilus alkalitolerans TaxID=3342712 RepID=A0ABV6VC70_9ACTN
MVTITDIASPEDSSVDPFRAGCEPRVLLHTVGDKWVTLVVNMLGDGDARFSELQRSVGGVSRKMLAQTLRTLERDGLVVRTVYTNTPPRVVYSLTPLGRTLLVPLRAVRAWCEQYVDAVSDAQAEFDGRGDVQPAVSGSMPTPAR